MNQRRRSTLILVLLLALAALPASPAQAAVVTVNSTTDVNDGDTSSISALIADPGPDGKISLREAILAANNTSGADTIGFDIPTSDPGYRSVEGVWIIQPASALPTLSGGGTTIDGYSQTGATPATNTTPAVLKIGIDGVNTAQNGLNVSSATNVIQGLAIYGFPLNGVYVAGNGATGNVIAGNQIGHSLVFGVGDAGNGYDGVYIALGAQGNTVGGDEPAERNVIGRNHWSGVEIHGANTTGNVVAGNYLGVGVNGTTDVGNTLHGVRIYGGAPDNTVGPGNLISGNDQDGVRIAGAGTTGNVVAGNYIGTDKEGTAALGNGEHGIYIIDGAQGNTVGGDTAGERNVISGNDEYGLRIEGEGTTGNTVSGNYIGVDVTGMADLGNRGGIYLYLYADNNAIGGDTAGERNVISGNRGNGVSIDITTGSVVSGNYIGTNAAGTAALGNGADGVRIASGVQSIIGGDTAGERNVISGNGDDGITLGLSGTMSNTISGNYVGTDASGTVALGNTSNGILIMVGAHNNTVGGDTPGERNVISANGTVGVAIYEAATGNVISGNYIGTNASGTAALGNGQGGVVIANTYTYNNIVGGDSPGEGNVISGNVDDGIQVSSGPMGTIISGNYIGTNAAGTAALSNTDNGVYVAAASNTIVGGDTEEERNVISGNGRFGVRMLYVDNGIISGNYIGTNASGTAALGNGDDGISFGDHSWSNTIGGDTAAERNVISGNGGDGIFLEGDGTTGNIISGNYVGTDVYGVADLGNAEWGVRLRNGAQNNIIGGSNATPGGVCSGECNLVSGNDDDGVSVGSAASTGNVISGNYIGVNASGTGALGNGDDGVYFPVAWYNTLGGDTAAERNVISGNGGDGVYFYLRSGENTISGNYIGTNAVGTAALGNGRHGVLIENSDIITIGGDTAGERNVISGNGGSGVQILGIGTSATHSVIAGNYIGTDAAGSGDLGNTWAGVEIGGGAEDNTVGGATAGERNLISGNDYCGVVISESGTAGNVVSGNDIGTSAAGTAALGNTMHGVLITSGAQDNTIGPGNVIAYSSGNGVEVNGSGTIRNTITQNSIFANAMGIDLVFGANGDIAAPAIDATTPGSIQISGIACANCTVEIFASPDSDGEGQVYLGSDTAEGGAFDLVVGSLPYPYLTATATDPALGTSEFSAVFTSTIRRLFLPLVLRQVP